MLKSHQERGQVLQDKVEAGLKLKKRKHYLKAVEGYQLLRYNGKAVAPSALQGRTLGWYRATLAHPGKASLLEAASSIFDWKSSREGATCKGS